MTGIINVPNRMIVKSTLNDSVETCLFMWKNGFGVEQHMNGSSGTQGYIANVATPILNYDAANKEYVDSKAGLSVKSSTLLVGTVNQPGIKTTFPLYTNVAGAFISVQSAETSSSFYISVGSTITAPEGIFALPNNTTLEVTGQMGGIRYVVQSVF